VYAIDATMREKENILEVKSRVILQTKKRHEIKIVRDRNVNKIETAEYGLMPSNKVINRTRYGRPEEY
jgi:hypothetical protein